MNKYNERKEKKRKKEKARTSSDGHLLIMFTNGQHFLLHGSLFGKAIGKTQYYIGTDSTMHNRILGYDTFSLQEVTM